MRVTKEELKKIPDGTKLKIFLSGSNWEEDFGKVFNAIKFNDNLYVVADFYDLDIDDPGYEIDVAMEGKRISF